MDLDTRAVRITYWTLFFFLMTHCFYGTLFFFFFFFLLPGIGLGRSPQRRWWNNTRGCGPDSNPRPRHGQRGAAYCAAGTLEKTKRHAIMDEHSAPAVLATRSFRRRCFSASISATVRQLSIRIPTCSIRSIIDRRILSKSGRRRVGFYSQDH